MSLFDQISNDIKAAMLARDKQRLEALRGIKKEFIEAKNSQRFPTGNCDDVALKILSEDGQTAPGECPDLYRTESTDRQNPSLPKRLLSSLIFLSPCRRRTRRGDKGDYCRGRGHIGQRDG